jgi:translation initiation factor IF-1
MPEINDSRRKAASMVVLNLNSLNAISGPPRRRRGGGRRRRRFQDRGAKKNTVEGEEKAVEMEGTISAVLAGTMFKVKLASGHELLAHISGKMRKRFIRLVVGDRVKMEMSPYDTSKARIVYRMG